MERKIYTGTVLIADGVVDDQGDSFDIDKIEVVDHEVVVTWNFDSKRPLGTGKMRKKGDRVVCAVLFYPDVEVPGMVPAFGGEMGTPLETPRRLKITGMALCDKNADSRIGPLKEK